MTAKRFNLKKFNKAKLFTLGILGVLGLNYCLHPIEYPYSLLDMIALGPSQLGVILFSVFGEFFSYFGGPLLQLSIPASTSAYLFSQGKPFFASLGLFWTAQNLFNIATYARDARALELDVPADYHIWHNILSRLELLQQDQIVGTLLYLCGIMMLLTALTLGCISSKR
jgi:hypothetical protein